MGIKEKAINALLESLGAEYIRLDDDGGISGFVVSSRFEELAALDRQQLIDEALQKGDAPLSEEELRQISMIAGLTPLEYESVGARIRIHKIKELEDGTLEVLLHGGSSDATYVRGALNNLKDVTTTDPEQSQGAIGILMTFCAQGTSTNRLTKEKAIGVLSNDQYIQVMQNV